MDKINEECLNVRHLVDNLKSEEMVERLRSIQSLQKIAEVLGPERTRSELLPFLQGIYYYLLYAS
jgi:serine/threonine-protein phosphatase 2A regulatory subunit A